MDKYKKYKIIVENARRKATKKKWKCLFPQCPSNSIKSHVLQKNGILNQIAKDRHVVQPIIPSLFKNHNFVLDFKLKGLKTAYTFPGFCSNHDSLIFKSIENEKNIDFYAKKSQYLFSYRSLCHEIWRKKRFVEQYLISENLLTPYFRKELGISKLGNEAGAHNFTFFKKEFEKAINNEKFENFFFVTFEVQKIPVCFSIPLNIGHSDIFKRNLIINGWDYRNWDIINTSFLNFFPSQDKSVFIIGFHKRYPCEWTLNLIERLKNSKQEEIEKEVTNLLITRLDFWCMSPNLYDRLSISKKNKMKRLYEKYYNTTETSINLDLNLFAENYC